MFHYPPQTLFNRVLPKSKIYAHAKPGRAVKELFVSHISEIVWKHKLSPETLMLPACRGITEIQVFEIVLKSDDCDGVPLRTILLTIDRAIPFPILFQLTHADRIRFAASYKRPSDADASQWVIEGSFVLPWQSAIAERPPLPVALDLAALYDQLIRRHIPLAPRPGETLRDQVARHLAIETKQREAQQLESRLAREKQFNRKVELNQQLRALSAELSELGHGLRQPAAAFPEPACWPGSQGIAEEKPEGSSFTSHSLSAAGYGDESGSRLPHSMS
jgi:Domain of unknown function (DUF4391)